MYPKVKIDNEAGRYKQKGSCLNSNYLQTRVSGNFSLLLFFFSFEFDSHLDFELEF